MKIVIAPDSFKGSLSSRAAAEAIERGIRKFQPHAEIYKVPIADGGEGTLECLLSGAEGQAVPLRVTGPLGLPVEAEYGLLGDGRTAVIEMAKASGLTLVAEADRDALAASTYGTGELIKHALDHGCRDFIVALGGSATSDGGSGMLEALGMRLLDVNGSPIARGGGALGRIAAIDTSGFDSRIAESRFVIAADVHNPLIGPYGAALTFGPQKGATPEQAEQLEHNLTIWAQAVERTTGIRIHDKPGSGAAGGTGGTFMAFFPCSIERGIDILILHTKLRDYLRGADLVITGEGRIDHQTALGKTPMGIAQEASKFGVPTVVLAGSVGNGIEPLYHYGIQAVLSIVNRPMTLQSAIDEAAELLEQAAEQVMRIRSF